MDSSADRNGKGNYLYVDLPTDWHDLLAKVWSETDRHTDTHTETPFVDTTYGGVKII